MRARTASSALLVCVAAGATALLTPLPAMAGGASVTCYSTGWANPRHTLVSYECDLDAAYATGEKWSGIQVSAASQGTASATGGCIPVTTTTGYYPKVTYAYDAAGDTTTTTSPVFLCPNQF